MYRIDSHNLPVAILTLSFHTYHTNSRSHSILILSLSICLIFMQHGTWAPTQLVDGLNWVHKVKWSDQCAILPCVSAMRLDDIGLISDWKLHHMSRSQWLHMRPGLLRKSSQSDTTSIAEQNGHWCPWFILHALSQLIFIASRRGLLWKDLAANFWNLRKNLIPFLTIIRTSSLHSSLQGYILKVSHEVELCRYSLRIYLSIHHNLSSNVSWWLPSLRLSYSLE